MHADDGGHAGFDGMVPTTISSVLMIMLLSLVLHMHSEALRLRVGRGAREVLATCRVLRNLPGRSGRSLALSKHFAQEYRVLQDAFCAGLCLAHSALLAALFFYWLGARALGADLGELPESRQVFVAAAAAVYLSVANVLPWLHNLWGLPVTYLSFVAFLCASMAPLVEGPGDDGMNGLAMVSLVFAAPAGGLACIPGTAIYFTCIGAYKAAASSPLDRLPLQLCLTTLASAGLVLHAASGVRIALEARPPAPPDRGAYSVLQCFCDHVLEVDALGVITAGLDGLRGLLLLTNASHSIKRELGEFLFSDDDRALVMASLEADSADIGAAMSVREVDMRGRKVDMRGICDTRVPVELFMVPSPTAGGGQGFLIGVKEHADDPRSDVDYSSSSQAYGSSSTDVRPIRDTILSDSSESSDPFFRAWELPALSGPNSLVCGPNTLELVPEDESGVARVAVWVDATEPDMCMIQCTRSFFTQFGWPKLIQGTSLLGWIAPNEREKFVKKMQAGLACATSGMRQKDMSVKFYPPCLRPIGAKVVIRMSLDLNISDPFNLVKLEFRRVHLVSAKQTPARRANPSAGAGGADGPYPTLDATDCLGNNSGGGPGQETALTTVLASTVVSEYVEALRQYARRQPSNESRVRL